MAAEIERKYEVPADFALDEGLTAAGATLGEPARHELVAVYYDTADLRLAADRVALRRRTGGTDAGWHVKRYRGGEDRDEVQLPAGRGAAVPAAVGAEVRAVSRGGALRPMVRMTTVRTEWPLVGPDGTVLALIADDEVASEIVADPAAGQRWRELEVELVEGDRDLLRRVDKKLRKAGATRSADPAKIARALEGRWPTADPVAGPPGSAAAVVGDYVRAQRDAIVGHDPRVRRDEPDAVHKMRVATRRLRSTFTTFRPLWDRAATDHLRAELKWLAEVLGRVRDAEVMAARLQRSLDGLPPELVVGPVAARLTGGLKAQAVKDHRSLVAALNGRRYAALLDELDALLAAEPTERGLRPAATYVPHRVRRTLATVNDLLDTAEKAAPDAPPLPGVLDRDTALHEARKSAKQARYAAEAAAPVGGAGAAALVTALEDLQELLGDQHDSVVTRDLLRTVAMQAHGAGENAFTYGRLHSAEAASATGVEAGLPAARKALSRKKAVGWLG
ncbi:MAG TPA: CYTH and CHAD domain-containing protein [Mycobacteriales bacterium]|nr:CYTH and CHAD domain-containing protein [Mycobacteriales bacterium]